MIELTSAHQDEIIAHARAEFPNECVGLLLGKDNRAERLLRMENIERSPLNYRVDPRELLRIFDEMDELGLQLVGIYHSHTHSPARPSKTDIAYAGYPDAHYLIVSLQDEEHPDLRAFTIVEGVVEEQEVALR
ncbi:MAG TPA: M67 family metallopeptidase [Chloroflexota bacterium]|nr:M67 family metallopeptidase [Chloroflexota bacterium]